MWVQTSSVPEEFAGESVVFPRAYACCPAKGLSRRALETAAEQLRDPVTKRFGSRHMAAADQAEGYGRIQLPTGNMQGSRDKGGDRETMSKGNSDDIVSSGFDCADANKYKRECSNEFREQRAKLGHLSMQSNYADADNLACRFFGA